MGQRAAPTPATDRVPRARVKRFRRLRYLWRQYHRQAWGLFTFLSLLGLIAGIAPFQSRSSVSLSTAGITTTTYATVTPPPVSAAAGVPAPSINTGTWACTSPTPYGGAYYAGGSCPDAGGVPYGSVTWTDTTNFSGADYAGKGNQPAGNWPYVGLGAYTVNAQIFSASPHQTATTYANNAQDWEFQTYVDTVASSYPGVTGFYNVGTNSYTGKIDQYTSLTQSASFIMPINTSTDAWWMFEDYTAMPGQTANQFGNEISIQTDMSSNGGYNGDVNNHQNGSGNGWNYGIIANNMNIGGQVWHMQDAEVNRNSSGACSPAASTSTCGQLVITNGCDANAVPHVTSQTITINTQAIIEWLETHAIPDSTGVGAGVSWGTVPDPCSTPFFSGTASRVADPTVANVINGTGPCASGGCPGWAPYPYVQVGSYAANLGDGWEITSTNSTTETFGPVTQMLITAVQGSGQQFCGTTQTCP